jgi:hypothetical protein
MKKALLACMLFTATASCPGQGIIPYHAADASTTTAPPAVAIIEGVPYSLEKYTRIVDGTPFFSDSWMNGKILLQNGSISRNLPLRLNLLENKVNYLNPKGQEMVITEPMRYLILTDSAGVEYSFLHGDQLTNDQDLQDVWFQVLVNSRISLCKQTKKAVRETKGYGSATAEQSIQTSDLFYVRNKNDFIHIKKWDDLLAALDDKRELVRQYSRQHHLNGRSQSDYIQLLAYYNSSL